ncbi:MAG: ParB/RepB/Spo0J family partition protein [Treponema sp.]|nr:ParB/RepB/Spo0J family partition protein [Treponema sp.]
MAKTSKFGLGKGLDALLPADDENDGMQSGRAVTEHGEDVVISLPLTKIRPNPNQPRKFFDEAALNEIAASIKEHGVIQPVLVEEGGDGYIIIAGERRFRAAAIAGLKEIPAIIRNYSEEKRLEVALIENVQRADLTPIEEAVAYKSLMNITGKSQDEIAAKVGKSRSTVANALRLLRLPPMIQRSLEKGEITSGHARALLAISDAATQERVFNEIVACGLSVREAEKIAARTEKPAAASPLRQPSKQRDPHLVALEEEMIEKLGAKVSVDGDFGKGVIRIEYYSMEDLDRLYELIVT